MMNDTTSIVAVAGPVCLALLGALAPGDVSGQQFCNKPVTPYCAETESEPDTSLQLNQCRKDLGDFEEQLKEYEQCVRDQIHTMRQNLSAAREALDEAREDF